MISETNTAYKIRSDENGTAPAAPEQTPRSSATLLKRTVSRSGSGQDAEPVSLERRDNYLELFLKTPQHSIDYALANIWGWAPYFGLQYTFEGNLCWLTQTSPEPARWAPVGDWKSVDWRRDSTLARGGTFIRVPEVLAGLWQEQLGGRVMLQESRGHWEYLYKTEELINLPGKRFHKKKNHINSYQKTYGEPEFRTLDEAVREDVLKLQDEWCQWHECANSGSLNAENDAINRVLAHWHQLPGLTGGALYVEKQIVAFSIGERLDETMLGVHYEKGRTGIRGVYQTINNQFALHAGSDYTYLNRAQDLDEEGLRQSKMTYCPADFLRKYTVHVQPA